VPQHGPTHSFAQNAAKKPQKSFLPASVRVYSLAMNPTQKQFSLTGVSLNKWNSYHSLLMQSGGEGAAEKAASGCLDPNSVLSTPNCLGESACKPSAQFFRSRCTFLLIPFRVLLMVNLLILSISVVNGLDCEIEGEINSVVYSLEGSVRLENRNAFTIWMSGDLWRIRMTPVTEDLSTSPLQYREAGTDGTNVYTVDVYNPKYNYSAAIRKNIQQIDKDLQLPENQNAMALKKLKEVKLSLEKRLGSRPKYKTSQNQAGAVVSPFPYPQYSFDQPEALIWLAYCSYWYLDHISDQRLPQVWPYEHPLQSETNNIVKALVVRENIQPRLPRHIAFINEGTDYDPSSMILITRRLQPPFDLGYTNAIFTTSTFTNRNGLAFPGHFSLIVYSPKAEAKNATDLRKSFSYEGVTTVVRDSCSSKTFRPDLLVSTIIQDNRFKDQSDSPIVYLSKAGPWMLTTNKTSLKEYEKQILSKLIVSKKRKRHLLEVILIITAVPGFLLVHQLWKKRVEAK